MHRHFICSPVYVRCYVILLKIVCRLIRRVADNLPTETDTNFLQVDAAHFVRNVGRYVNFEMRKFSLFLDTLVECIRIKTNLEEGFNIEQLTSNHVKRCGGSCSYLIETFDTILLIA